MTDAPDNRNPFNLGESAAFGFSDTGERVPVAWPERSEPPEVELLGRLKETGAFFPDESAALEIIGAVDRDQRGRTDGQQIILKLIARLTAGKNAKQAGQMVFILAHRLKLPGCQTQMELAERLEMTQGRVSQLISEIGKPAL